MLLHHSAAVVRSQQFHVVCQLTKTSPVSTLHSHAFWIRWNENFLTQFSVLTLLLACMQLITKSFICFFHDKVCKLSVLKFRNLLRCLSTQISGSCSFSGQTRLIAFFGCSPSQKLCAVWMSFLLITNGKIAKGGGGWGEGGR